MSVCKRVADLRQSENIKKLLEFYFFKVFKLTLWVAKQTNKNFFRQTSKL